MSSLFFLSFSPLVELPDRTSSWLIPRVSTQLQTEHWLIQRGSFLSRGGLGNNFFFIFCTTEQTQRACRPVLPMGPMLLTFEPFQVQLHSPASLTSVEKTDRKESMPVPGRVAKKRNPGGAAKLSVWEPWKRRTESWLAARETTNIVHPWVKMKERCHFHLCLSHRLLIAWLLPSIQGWVRCLTGV